MARIPRLTPVILAAAALLMPVTAAQAEVAASSEAGFVSKLSADVAASPAAVWQALIAPAGWWNSAHTYSGDAANLTLDPRATGCFCEGLPVAKDAPAGTRRGSIEHMRVIYAEPGRVLRMSGALGPLQSEAIAGTLTITLKPIEGGTRIQWFYVVGGYMRQPATTLAPLVDRVMAEQLQRLAEKLSPLGPPPAAVPPPPGEAAPADAR